MMSILQNAIEKLSSTSNRLNQVVHYLEEGGKIRIPNELVNSIEEKVNRLYEEVVQSQEVISDDVSVWKLFL